MADARPRPYENDFDFKHYLKTFYSELHPIEEITLRKLEEIFSQGTLKGRIERCIDIGCGPTVHRLSAPSKVCETLVYSDYGAGNRKFVKDWLGGLESDERLDKMFRVCAQLEGFEDVEEGAIVIQNRIKSKCSAVLPINVLEPKPFGRLNPEPFDVAFSAACLEVACNSYESYVAGLRNIGTIIRPGGYLILKGYLDDNYYTVNKVTFPVLNFTEDMLTKAIAEGGFNILDIEVIEHKKVKQVAAYNDNSDVKGSFCALAQKV